MSKVPYLQAQKITRIFDQGSTPRVVLKEISHDFEKDGCYGLIGASGSGKSTLLSILAGLESPTVGQVLLNGYALYRIDSNLQLKLRSEIGVLFQAPYLINELSLLENIMIQGLIKQPSYESSKKALDLLDQVGLSGREQQQPRSLSLGEQQRACIARVLFNDPSFIIADEPTAHLDLATSKDIMAALFSYQKERGAGLIIATHDPLVIEMLDQTLLLDSGALHTMRTSHEAQLLMKEQ
jgi:putative ABC transport system ATP-binding protein